MIKFWRRGFRKRAKEIEEEFIERLDCTEEEFFFFYNKRDILTLDALHDFRTSVRLGKSEVYDLRVEYESLFYKLKQMPPDYLQLVDRMNVLSCMIDNGIRKRYSEKK